MLYERSQAQVKAYLTQYSTRERRTDLGDGLVARSSVPPETEKRGPMYITRAPRTWRPAPTGPRPDWLPTMRPPKTLGEMPKSDLWTRVTPVDTAKSIHHADQSRRAQDVIATVGPDAARAAQRALQDGSDRFLRNPGKEVALFRTSRLS